MITKKTFCEILKGQEIANVYEGRPDGSILIRFRDRTEIVIWKGIIRRDDEVSVINGTPPDIVG